MRQSKLFIKTIREAPRDEPSINAQLLIRAGFINKLAAGIYTFLPLGFLVLKKIENIIREEMLKIGGQELSMPVLHPKKLWQKTGRWETMDVLYKLNKEGGEFALGPTHEEVVVPLAKQFIRTYKDLPAYFFQIQVKFRKEKRARSGLLRCREFLMKDLYSFHEDEKDLQDYYKKVENAYFKIFKRTGIGKKTFLTYASGGTFSKFSHEFQTVAQTGEDTIYICQKCSQAINKEIKSQVSDCPNCGGKRFLKEKAIEVGNIFQLKTKFSDPFGLHFIDKSGKRKLVLMGCYGIGLGRLMGTLVELFHDEKGIIWPEGVAPFLAHLIPIEGTSKIKKETERIYKVLVGQKKSFEILYDDRDNKTPGEKFIDADLIGIPYRLVVSQKTLRKKSVEIKKRDRKTPKLIKIGKLKKFFDEKLR
jgi:prolyl-tRNA synthetase